jgi:copper homeostasis protein
MSEDSVLEIIVCSFDDALAAARGGAGRLEVISRFDLEGLTPDLETVKQIVEHVDLPVRVMIRNQPHFLAETGAAWEHQLEAARRLASLPINGFVLGFLANGAIDERALSEVLACAPHLPATFHRAFEEVTSVTAAIGALKRHDQIDRILISGGREPTLRAERLAAIDRVAGPEMRVIAGGGIDERAISIIRAATRLTEFHVGRAARTPPEVDGAVDEQRVRELKRRVTSEKG